MTVHAPGIDAVEAAGAGAPGALSEVPRAATTHVSAPADSAAPATRRAAEAASSPGVALRLEGLRKSFGPRAAVDSVSLDVVNGELLAILGPSGCGKSTLLRIIAGLERPDGGRVFLRGVDATDLPPAARGCGVVFQSYALFPNLTAAANVAFGLDRRRHGRKARASRARELLELVGLTDSADRYPAQLSGGQQQRIALARALATEPALLLLDEPLSALDAKVRATLRGEIRRLQQATRLTTLLVTHDQEEALTMADRVAVMNAGRLAQVGEPREVYSRPADEFVASFVGAMNLLEGWAAGPGKSFVRAGAVLRTREGHGFPAGSRVTVAFRPEEASLEGAAPPLRQTNALPCRVERVEFRGPFVRHYLSIRSPAARGVATDAVLVDVAMHDATRLDLRPGEETDVHVPPESVRVFPAAEATR